MIKTDDLKSLPVVGKFYLVPHVKLTSKEGETPILVPVINNYHEDPELGPNVGWHYHFDMRFFTPKGRLNYMRYMPGPFSPIPFKEGRTNLAAGHRTIDGQWAMVDKELIYKKRKCIRLITGVEPGYKKLVERHGHLPLYYNSVKWRLKFDGMKAHNMRCPHQGFDLSQCPVKNGVIECPLHGLKFRKKTMTVIPLQEEIEL